MRLRGSLQRHWRSVCLATVSALVSLPVTTEAQTAAAPPPFAAPGKLVEVGGWRLHLHCTGDIRTGQPTVILEAGKGDFSVEWSLVQPGIARFARVCSYDRAGDGWSELGPHPRTMKQITYELHELLARAGERPPFVLVGHSYGAWLVRVYQSTYPADVAGLVLVESGGSDPWRMMPDGRLVRSSELVTNRPIPPVKTAGPLRVSDIPPGALSQMMAGLATASASANEPPRNKLPGQAQQMRTWALGQLGHVAAAVNPFEHDELAALRAAHLAAERPLGELPLVVITRGLPDEQGPNAQAMEEDHRRDQALLAGLSRTTRHITAAGSGHHVQLDEPNLVIQEIQQLLDGLRNQRRKQRLEGSSSRARGLPG
jgi:pimeloyl-ACP methyl ester carboxylesterase